jgi:drug/metabolite transporter (DMT)-like permease
VSRERSGLLLCALAAAGFGAMAIFGKLAYGAGAGVLELLAVRFVIAAGVLGALARHRGATFPRGRALAAGLALRPLHETVEDTWRWLQASGDAADPPPPRGATPLSAEREREALARLGS